MNWEYVIVGVSYSTSFVISGEGRYLLKVGDAWAQLLLKILVDTSHPLKPSNNSRIVMYPLQSSDCIFLLTFNDVSADEVVLFPSDIDS